MAGAEWTSRGRRSLDGVATYIAVEGGRPKSADKLVDAIYAKAESYGRQPTMGALHEDLPENFRYFVHKRYVIVYETLTDGILVHVVCGLGTRLDADVPLTSHSRRSGLST